jgi:hypothetical protein
MPRSTGPASPEAVPPYVRVKEKQAGGTPPGGEAPPSDEKAPRGTGPVPFGGASREWVPLAIGAVVLLLCAVLLFFGGRFVLAALGPTTTPTRLAVVPQPTTTAVPTAMRIPTQALPPPTTQPVLAKVIEKSVNVRAEPNTKAKIISSLKQNNQISLVGRNAAGDWYQVNISGATQVGWVFGETLQIVSGDPKSLPVAGAGAPTPTKAAALPQIPGASTPTVIGARPPGQ